MSNAWASIAFKASCAATLTPRRPVLRLFNGFKRSIHKSSGTQTGLPCLRLELESIYSDSKCRCFDRRNGTQHNFCTSSALAAQRNRSKPKVSKLNTRSLPREKLQTLKSAASHTEGLSETPPLDKNPITWRDYDPIGGMPLPDGELSKDEVKHIFGDENMTTDLGNYMLSVIHWRRQSGALIDVGLAFPQRDDVGPEQALLALEYLRTKLPDVDEQANGQKWAEEETERLREQLRERAVSIGLYKPDKVAEEEEEYAEEEQQGTEWGRERSGESALDRIRLEKEALFEQQQALKAEKQRREELAAMHSVRGPLELSGGVQPSVALTTTGGNDVSITGPQTKAWLVPVERKPWVKYYEEQATIIKDNAVPQLRTLQRLGPTLLVVFFTVALCVYASENYTPPPTSARMFPDTPPSVATLGALTALLCTTFVLSRFPPLWRTSSKFFTVVPAYPYAFSLLGAPFRHDTVTHLASNLVSLWLFGLALHEDVGRGTFLAIFLGTGVLGGYASLFHNVINKRWMTYVFGSSGCVLGVVGALCALHPNGTIKVLGYEIPVAAWLFLALYGTAELYAVFRMKNTTIDHVGHVGGMLSGVGAALWLRGKAAKARQDSDERSSLAVFTPAST